MSTGVDALAWFLLSFIVGSVVCAVICFRKGKIGLGVVGLLGIIPPLALFVVWFPLVGAITKARPGSPWERARRGKRPTGADRGGFPAAIGEPGRVTGARSSPPPATSEPSQDAKRSAISDFIHDAWARGIISDDAYRQLLDFLRGEPVSPPPPPEPLLAPESVSPPEPVIAPEPVVSIPPPAPRQVPLTPAVETRRPAPPQPAPPPPRKPNPVTTMGSQVWDAVASDIAVHGFAYLGVLFTFVGVLGFLLFAFADVPDAAQPFIELFVALIFFGWAWLLRRQGATSVAGGMELVGGMVLPLILFAGFVDGAPFPPDFEGAGLIVALTVTSVLLALSYRWYTATHTDSTLRYLVAPLLWLGALTAGFVFKTDEALSGDAITRLVSPQPGLAAAAVALTLAVCHSRRDHRLALPTVTAAWVGLPVAYLLVVSLSVGEGWVRTWPMVVLGVSTFVAAEILLSWYGKQSWAAQARPFLLAGVLLPLTPTLQVGWAGLLVTTAYLVLFELTFRVSAGSPRLLILSAGGVVVGAGMTLAQPWPALISFTFISLWAHRRRVDTWATEGVGQTFLTAAAIFPVGIGYALVQIVEPGVAWMVMAGLLAAITGAVRWRRSEDAFWPYWLSAAALAVALGAVTVWLQSDQSDGFATAAVLTAALTVGLAPRWPIPRLWMATGLLLFGLAMVFETLGLPTDRRILLWSSLGLGLVLVAGTLRRPPAGHMAAIGHLIGAVTLWVLPGGTVGTTVLGAWVLGWVASTVSQELGGDSLAALLARVSSSAGRRGDDATTAPGLWLAPVVMVASLPPAAINLANLSPTFLANRSWTGALLSTISLAYAAIARVTISRRPLSAVLSTAAVVASIIGVAVAAPDSWPVIYASAAVIGVAILLTGRLRQGWFVWFAWVISVVMVLFLGERAGVPTASLHVVTLIWGGVMVLGGLITDQVRAGRRALGEGLRIRWLRHPVLLGSLVAPVSLTPVFTEAPQTYGWWAIGAAAAYFGVAYLLRAGAVTAPAFGLVALGSTALSPRSLLDEPWLFIAIAAPMVGAAWIAEQLQPEAAASDGWLRWDLPPLLIAHLVGVFALVTALGNGTLFSTALAFGLLALAIGVWRRHRIWIDAGNLLILASMYQAGSGWLAIALAGTSLRGVIGAWRSHGLTRASNHAIGILSAGLAWLVFIDWLGVSMLEAVNYSALAFGGLGLAVSIAAWLLGVRFDTVVGWGGLAVTGLVVAGATAVGPGGPGVVGPSLAIGIVLLSAAFEIAASRVHPSLRLLSVGGAGLAWLALAAGLAWDRADTVNYSSLGFGILALSAGVAARLWNPPRVDVVRWGGLGMAGVLVAGLVSIGRLGDTITGPWVALGMLMLAVSFELAWKTVDLSLRYLAAATTGLAWLALAAGLAWDRADTVNYSSLGFGLLALSAGVAARLWNPPRVDVVRWGGLGIAGVLVTGLVSIGRLGDTITGPWVALGMLMLAVSFELAWKTVDLSLRYLAAATTGLAWLALAAGLAWDRPFAVGATIVVFGALMMLAIESMRLLIARLPGGAEPEMATLEVARAWAGLGALGIVVGSLMAEGTGGLTRAGFWVAAALAVLAFGAARAARPLQARWLRESSVVVALISINRLMVAADWADETRAVGIGVLAALAAFGSLALWRRQQWDPTADTPSTDPSGMPGTAWVQPLVLLAVLSNTQALIQGLTFWPHRTILIVVLLSLGAQSLAVGLTRNSAGVLAVAPPLVGLSFILAIADGVSGTAQWYTVPVALVLLSEVEILRRGRRATGGDPGSADALILEWAGIGLLAAPSLVEMFTSGLGFGLIALAMAAAILLWAIVTRVRRRAVAAASLAVATAVLLVVAAAALAAPASAFFWIVAAGIGFAVMLVAAFVEAYRSRRGQPMIRLRQLMEGWE